MGRITYDADMNSDPRAENQPTADSGHNVVLVGIDLALTLIAHRAASTSLVRGLRSPFSKR